MDIHEAIEKRQKQIRRLQQEIATLENAKALLEDQAKTEQPRSQADMAAFVLEETGKPMHVRQIQEHIKRTFNTTIKAPNLAVLLFRYSKRGSRFYKVNAKPNTYGLLKWQIADEISENQSAA